MQEKQNLRKPIGTLVLIAFLLTWLWGATTLAPVAGRLHFLLEMGYYLAAGTFWAIPLKPLFDWMNAGEPPEQD
jgi:hypothetical protein